MINELFQSAVAHKNAGRLAEASDAVLQILAMDGNHVEALSLLGYLKAIEGRIDEAIRAFETAIRIRPNFAEGYNNLGAIAHDQGRFAEAMTFFQRAIELLPAYASAIDNLIATSEACGRQMEAAQILSGAITKSPPNAPGLYACGRLFLNQKNWELAQLYLLRAALADRTNANICVHLAFLYWNLGCLSDVESYLRTALQLQPDHADALRLLKDLSPDVQVVTPDGRFPHVDGSALDAEVVALVKMVSIYDYAMEDRLRVANELSRFLSVRVPYINPSLAIRQIGYSRLKPILSPSHVNELVGYFKREPVFNGHVPSFSDRVRRPLTDDYAFSFGAYELEQTLRAPHLLEAALNPYILHLVSEYLGCTPVIYSLQAWWSIPTGQKAETQQFHRDQDDFRFLVLFIYLTDVDKSNGPHCYLRHSHVGTGEGEDVIVGPAGTTILADTYGLHKGIPPTTSRRLVAWVRYGLYRNHHAGPDRLEPVSRSLVANRIRFDNETRYITRLLFKD